MAAMVFKHLGVILCQLGQDIFENQIIPIFPKSIYCDARENFVTVPNALQSYWNPLDPDFFYITASSPPEVIELIVSDPYNAFISN